MLDRNAISVLSGLRNSKRLIRNTQVVDNRDSINRSSWIGELDYRHS